MSTSETQEVTPEIEQGTGAIQPQFTLTGDALVQMAIALANAIKTRREDATPSRGEQISLEKDRKRLMSHTFLFLVRDKW